MKVPRAVPEIPNLDDGSSVEAAQGNIQGAPTPVGTSTARSRNSASCRRNYPANEATMKSRYERNIRSSFVSGSYILSTTRSFRGMIALSVMVISSGQTLVQHLVMLQ